MNATSYTEDGITGEAGSSYVWLDCERYGLPDTTMGKIGQHVVYLPVADNLDPALRQRCCAVVSKAEELRQTHLRAIEAEDGAREDAEFDAWELRLGRPSDPALVAAWRDEIEAKRREWDRGINEGGEGYNPYRFGG